MTTTILTHILWICIVIIIIVALVSLYGKKDTFVIGRANEMLDWSNEQKKTFIGALLSYNPKMMKYQDPNKYDFHTCGMASQYWKDEFLTFINSLAELALDKILMYPKVIILFDKANLQGNVIFVPLEGQYPRLVQDTVAFRKYITWQPPSNIISAFIPAGFRVRVEFYIEGIPNQIETKYIEDGITKAFVIAQPIKSMTIEKI